MSAATATMATLVQSIIDNIVAFTTEVLTNYWPYMLAFMVISGVLGWAMGFFGRVARGKR